MRIVVSEENFYRRLDRFLRKTLSDVPLSAIYKFIRKGNVLVNGKSVKRVGYELKPGDTVEIRHVDLESYRRKKEDLVPQKIDLDVIYEDDSILVVNKPPGIALHPGKGLHMVTLIEGLIHYGMERGFEPHLVHRLDYNTSGVLVVAKGKRNARILTDLFKRRAVSKTYITLVKGKVEGSGRIDRELDGQEASTEYESLSSSSEVSLLRVRIKTGRKHQIRRHMALVGNPVVGDNRYGDKRFNRYFKRRYGLKRQFLHCRELKILHPKSGIEMRFEADLWEDLESVLKKLGFPTP